MEISRVADLLTSLVNTKANPLLKETYLKAIPIFCEKLQDSGLLDQVVTKEWIFRVRLMASDANAANTDPSTQFLLQFIQGITSGMRKAFGDPGFADYGLKDDLLVKAQTGKLTSEELFEGAPEVAFPISMTEE